MKLLRECFPLVYTIAEKIAHHKGRAFLVGGAVRDYILGLPVKDIDIEVHDLLPDQLEEVLREYGPVSVVGKSFGVLRLHGVDADWSLPRTDSAGRKPTVHINPFMSVSDAAYRRDLTMNAMAIDMMTDELVDPFGGKDDIKNKVLRAPDTKLFMEDPLRFFRVMQFVSRFEMLPDEALNKVCSSIVITDISRERIEEEFRKLLLYSRCPSLGIRWLQSIGRLRDVLPELADTVGVAQNPVWHPEGDVFEHSMQSLDAAAIIGKTYESEFKRLVLLYAALCHDLGKVTTTREVNGVIKSIGHEVDSKKLALIMMRRITHNSDVINAVGSLVLHHMAPLQFVTNKAKLPAYKRLANKLSRLVSMRFLADLCLADKRGRNGAGKYPLSGDNADVDAFLASAQRAGVLDEPEGPVLTGADLLGIVTPGPQMGRLLERAYEIQINDSIVDKQVLLARIGIK